MLAFAQPEQKGRVDWLQWLALLGLMTVGSLFIYSATLAHQVNSVPWYKEQWFRQIIWYSIGTGFAGGICVIDYRSLARWALVAYWGTIITLVAVLVPGIGTSHGWGALRWIDLG